jgi:predicted DNA-binding transcriptional regulator AlpA
MNPRLLSIDQVRAEKGVHLAVRYIRKLIRLGRFPRPVALAGGRRKVFIESEIDDYIAGKIADRDRGVA